MKHRVKLITIILRKCKMIGFFPFMVTYCILPCITLSKYFTVGASEACDTFIYMSQVFFPLCSLLWPMGYLHIWIEGDACESLHAYSKYHKSCIGEMLLLYGAYLLLISPIIIFAVILFQVSWLEFFRLIIQTCIVISFFYFMAMLFRNVTIGCIPVISYLFLCLYISGSAEFASFSIIEPTHPVEFANWRTLYTSFLLSLFAFLLGYLLDRFGKKFN